MPFGSAKNISKAIKERQDAEDEMLRKAGIKKGKLKQPKKKKKKKGDPYIEGAGYFTGKGWYKPHRRDRKH